MNKPARWAWGITLAGLLASGCGLSQLSPATDRAAEAQLLPVASPEPSPVAPAPRLDAAALRADTRSGAGRPDRIRVRPGDTLWGIAARPEIYDSGWCYPLLIHANAARLPDPGHPRAGTLLVVPRDLPWSRVEAAEEEAMTGQLLLGRRARPALPKGKSVDALPVPPPPAAPPPAPTAAPVPTAFPTAIPDPAMPPSRPAPSRAASGGLGSGGWLLLGLAVAALAALAWILGRG